MAHERPPPDAEVQEWLGSRLGISPDKKERMLNLLAAMRLTSIKEIMISFEDVEESQVFKDMPKKDRDSFTKEFRKLDLEWKTGYMSDVAKSNGLLKVMRKGLIQEGGIEDRCNVKQETPLIKAVKRGNMAEVQVLLDAGADIGVRNKDEWTVVMIAAADGHLDMVKLLVDKGGRELASAKNSYGKTAHILARQHGMKEVANYLQSHA